MFYFPVLGLLAGWLLVMPASVLTLAVRVDELSPASSVARYSTLLASGWLVLIIGLIALGRFGDRLSSRRPLFIFGVIGSLGCGYLLSVADNLATFGLAWTVLQLPAAAIITGSLAQATVSSARSHSGLMSGLTGGAPVFALLLAMVISVSIELSASAAFLGTSILAAFLTLPVTWQTKKADSKSALIEANQHDAHTAKLINSWWQFVLVAFLLSCTTSAANGYLYAYANTSLGLKVDDATLFVTKLVLIASALSLVAGTIDGVVARRRHLTTSTYALGAVLVGAAVLAMAMAPSIKMAIICAAVFGTGFGIANGLELSLFMQAKLDPSAAGKLLGIFTAATTLPYVLVPFIASWLLRSGSEFTILNLWTGAAVLAAGSALLAWRIKVDA